MGVARLLVQGRNPQDILLAVRELIETVTDELQAPAAATRRWRALPVGVQARAFHERARDDLARATQCVRKKAGGDPAEPSAGETTLRFGLEGIAREVGVGAVERTAEGILDEVFGTEPRHVEQRPVHAHRGPIQVSHVPLVELSLRTPRPLRVEPSLCDALEQLGVGELNLLRAGVDMGHRGFLGKHGRRLPTPYVDP